MTVPIRRDFPRAIEVRSPVWIPMPDGERLAVTLYIPGRDTWPNPCIIEALPYRKDDLTSSYRPEYLRLRDEGYQAADLARWADRLAAQAGQWDDAFVYFKHEGEGKGPEFAAAFVDLLNARGVTTA